MDFFDHDMIPCYEIIVALDVDIKTFGYNIKDTIISKISPVKKLWFDIRFISRIFSIYKYTYIYMLMKNIFLLKWTLHFFALSLRFNLEFELKNFLTRTFLIYCML